MNDVVRGIKEEGVHRYLSEINSAENIVKYLIKKLSM